MGMATKLHINNMKWNVDDVKILLKTQLLVEEVSNIKETNSAGYYTIDFLLNGSQRQLNIFANSNVGGLPCLTLDLASDPDSRNLFRAMGYVLGGVFVEDDCSAKSMVYQDRSIGNLEFLVKRAQLQGINSPEDFISYLKKTL